MKLTENYTIGTAVDYCKKSKRMTILLALVFFVFPYAPPYFMGFDPRIESQIMPFYVYLITYYILFVVWLGKCSDKPRKIRAVMAEKAILMGCPIEMTTVGNKAKNSYITTVQLNEAMKEKLYQLHAQDEVELEEEKVALKEPFVEKIQIGSATSLRFIGKTVPHYEQARKIGVVPELPPQKKE